METTTEAKIQFLKALNKVQGLLAPAVKDSLNPHFKSKYASLAAVNEAVMGPISEAGFVLLSGGWHVDGKAYLRTTLFHVGGHSESFDYPLIEKTDNPQHIASSVTYARRYSICALFNLDVEDDDGNAATEGTKATSQTQAVKHAAKSTSSADMQVAVFVPAGVTTKTGEGPRGPWTRYAVKSPGGDMYSTFDETAGQIAISAADDEKEVKIVYKQDGKYFNILKIALHVEADVPFS